MKAYIISLCCTAIAAAIACLLAPGDGKGVKFVSGLCVLAAFAYPLADIIGDLKNIDLTFDTDTADNAVYTQMMYESLDEISRENVCSDVGKILTEQFGISENNFEAAPEITRNGGSVSIEKIYIILTNIAVFEDPRSIKDYIERIFDCECIVSAG